MKRYVILITAITLAALLFYCSGISTVGNGGSSETVNAKVVFVDTTVSVTIDDNTGSDFTVHSFAADYRPYEKTGYSSSATVLQGGSSTLSLPSHGTYNFLLACASKNIACFIGTVTLADNFTDTIDCTLSGTQNVQCEIVATNESKLEDLYIVSIDGSPFYALVNPKNGFFLNALPSGGYSLNLRPWAKRLFIGTSRYSFTVNNDGAPIRLRIVLP